MTYLVVSRNGEESFYKFVTPDQDPNPDHLREGPSHGHNTSCVKIKSVNAIVFESLARTDKQTDPNALHSHSSPGPRVT